MVGLAFTYAILDSFSIAFLMILFISTRERSTRLADTRCFRAIVLMTATALAMDMMAWQLDGRPGMICHSLLWIVNILCYILSGAMTFTWFYYTGLKTNRLNRVSNWAWALIATPLIFLVVVSVLSPWTHWLFYLDGNNVYQRGSLFAIQMVIPFAYIFAAAFWSLNCARKERLRQQRLEYLYLSSFIIFPLIGGILQLAIYGVSLAWPCAALSLMLVYVSMQNQKISLDALTGLNNRGQFDKYLYGCIEHSDSFSSFALFMLDIDEFKKINDNFGHIAGDAALIDASSLLKRALIGTNSFLARYGGDEFAIVLHYVDKNQIDSLLSKIADESERRSRDDAVPYNLVFSVGYVEYDKHRYSNYQDMIIAADAHMYRQKSQHKAAKKQLDSDVSEKK